MRRNRSSSPPEIASASRGSRGRLNRAKFDIDEDLTLDDGELEEGIAKMADSHWFDQLEIADRGEHFHPLGGLRTPPKLRVLDLEKFGYGDLPVKGKHLVEMGRLVRMHVRTPKKNPTHPRRDRDTMIELSRKASEDSYLAWDARHPGDRMYFIFGDEDVRQVMKERFWDHNNAPEIPLNDLAVLAGGRHGKSRDYLDCIVKPVGIMTAVVYFTHKNNDGPSYYIHKMAELTHHYPILACDEDGRLWIAGGNYTVPNPGITD